MRSSPLPPAFAEASSTTDQSVTTIGNNSNLSEDERRMLNDNLKRANEFELATDLEIMRLPMEGCLLKFTNVVKGWQARWFYLDPLKGELRYYLKESHKEQNKIRGCLTLVGAVVTPNEDDLLAFTISPVAGDSFKLKAGDTKTKQAWINRLRTIAEDKNEQKMKTLLHTTIRTPKLSANVCEGTAKQVATFGQLHEVLETCRRQHYQLCSAVDRCDIDRELLLCKAISRALLESVEHCERMIPTMALTTLANDFESSTSTIPESSDEQQATDKSTATTAQHRHDTDESKGISS